MSLKKMWRTFGRLDKSFVVQYTAYHHFRNKGWVVRSGVKYGVDFGGSDCLRTHLNWYSNFFFWYFELIFCSKNFLEYLYYYIIIYIILRIIYILYIYNKRNIFLIIGIFFTFWILFGNFKLNFIITPHLFDYNYLDIFKFLDII